MGKISCYSVQCACTALRAEKPKGTHPITGVPRLLEMHPVDVQCLTFPTLVFFGGYPLLCCCYWFGFSVVVMIEQEFYCVPGRMRFGSTPPVFVFTVRKGEDNEKTRKYTESMESGAN